MDELMDEADHFEDALEKEWRRTYGIPAEEKLAS